MITFKEWYEQRSLKEMNDDGTDDMGRVVDQNKYDAFYKKNRQAAAEPNRLGSNNREIHTNASRLLDDWMTQPNVLKMLVQDVSEQKPVEQNKAFLGFLQGNKLGGDIGRKLGEELKSKIVYYIRQLHSGKGITGPKMYFDK